MSVLSCDRHKCENIMCGYFIEEIGYICWDCKSEFEEYLASKGLEPSTEGEILRELRAFMKTPKGTYKEGKAITVTEFFYENRR